MNQFELIPELKKECLAFLIAATLLSPVVHARDNDKRDNTLIGVGVGLLGGAILSNGDPWASIAGAAAGGVIGNIATDDRKDDRRDRDRRNNGRSNNRNDWGRGHVDRNHR